MEEVNILKEMPPRNPTNGTFELTIRCNLHCKMCLFRHADCENAEITTKELNTEQWIDMAKQVAEAGTLTLLITGGEPMLRPDFCEIWEGIYKQGFLITLYTNATLVSNKIMETLRRYPPHKIGITIYGANEATYEKVCGNKDMFNRMLKGVNLLLELPSTIEFRTTIIRENQNDIIGIERLVKEKFGKKYHVMMTSEIHQSVRGACANVNECRLDPKQMRKIQEIYMRERAREVLDNRYDADKLKFDYSLVKKEPDCKTLKLSLFGCLAGMDRYTITWDGKLLACQLLGVFQTNAIKDGFHSAWEEFPKKVKLPPNNPKCQKCEVQQYCQTCYASRYAESGELNGCSEYIYLNAYSKKEIITI